MTLIKFFFIAITKLDQCHILCSLYIPKASQKQIYCADIGWLPEGSRSDGFSKHFAKGPLLSAGVQKGGFPQIGYLRVPSDVSAVEIEIFIIRSG